MYKSKNTAISSKFSSLYSLKCSVSQWYQHTHSFAALNMSLTILLELFLDGPRICCPLQNTCFIIK